MLRAIHRIRFEATGPDNINISGLKDNCLYASSAVYHLNRILKSGVFHDSWEFASACPLNKILIASFSKDFKPISSLLSVAVGLEHIFPLPTNYFSMQQHC